MLSSFTAGLLSESLLGFLVELLLLDSFSLPEGVAGIKFDCIDAQKMIDFYVPVRNFFQLLMSAFAILMTSSSVLDFRRALTVIPILVLVKMSRVTGNFCKALRSSSGWS